MIGANMPRDKHTTSLGKARGGPRRTTRLDHRGWLAPRPPSTARRVEEEQEDKEVSVTASSESNDDASENESLEGVLDTSRNVPGGLVTNEVSSQIVGGWPVLANVVSTEEFTRMEVPSPETKNQSKAAEVKPKAATKPKKPKAPKTTQIRVSNTSSSLVTVALSYDPFALLSLFSLLFVPIGSQ